MSRVFVGLRGLGRVGDTPFYEVDKGVLASVSGSFTVGCLFAVGDRLSDQPIFGDWDGGVITPTGDGFGFTLPSGSGTFLTYADGRTHEFGPGNTTIPGAVYGAPEEDALKSYWGAARASDTPQSFPIGFSPRFYQMVLAVRRIDTVAGTDRTFMNGQSRISDNVATYTPSAEPLRFGACSANSSPTNAILCGAFIHNSALSDDNISDMFLHARHAKALQDTIPLTGSPSTFQLDYVWSVARNNFRPTPLALWPSVGAQPSVNMTLTANAPPANVSGITAVGFDSEWMSV